MLMNSLKHKGFTIVELLIVIVVIAILAAITIVAYNNIQGMAKYNKINAELVSMKKLIEMYKAENGTYPPTAAAFRYQRVDGNNFIPGVVPTYTNMLPQVTNTPYGGNTNDTYIYSSNTAATGYVLQRLYQTEVPASEWAQVPAAQKQGAYLDRYGYGANMSGY